MEETRLLSEFSHIEEKLNLYSITTLGIPMYRLFRYKTRLAYINTKVPFSTRNTALRTIGRKRIKIFSGFWKFINKEDLSIFFPFNRLSKNEETFFDKFTDPVIELSCIRDKNYLIVEPSDYIGGYDRVHKNNVVANESRTFLFLLVKEFFLLISPLFSKKRIDTIFAKINTISTLPESVKSTYFKQASLFWANYYYFYFWFLILKPKRVFCVFREGYFPIIAVCKKLSIPIAEFQHGVTLDKTMAYMGNYDSRIDPDYFLSFGTYWKSACYAIPENRMVRVGWAYKQFLGKDKETYNEDAVLVISSTAISTQILNAIANLSIGCPKQQFHIRLHPNERYNEQQQMLLSRISNALIVDNKTESFSVLPSYKYVIGEASSVLFEALSVGCRVGMLNLCGLRPPIDKQGIKENFFVINDANDFEQFLNIKTDSSKSQAEFYSDFDSKGFMEFIENKM